MAPAFFPGTAALVPGLTPLRVPIQMSLQIGVAKGLLEGLENFLDMLKGAAKFAFDSAFRDEVMKRAAQLIGPVSELMGPIPSLTLPGGQSNPNLVKLLAVLKSNGRAIGKNVGEVIGTEINDQVVQKSANEICEFIGRLVGLVLFEVVLAIITELLGMAAVQGARWIGEGASIVGRILPKIRPLVIGAFEETRNFFRARLGLQVVDRAAEAARAAEGVVEAAEDVGRAMKSSAEVERAFNATMTEPEPLPRPGGPTAAPPEVAAGFKLSELGAFKRLLGKPLTSPETKNSRRALGQGRQRGGCRRTYVGKQPSSL
jgi:hypothetical protein